ncbi:MAG TPA: hypothetical protein VF749_13580 [Candidatus Acidoferrum sp.]
MGVPLRLRATKEAALREEALSSLNISALRMPKEIAGDAVEEWSFTGRVAHLEALSRKNGKSGVGVQFLF